MLSWDCDGLIFVSDCTNDDSLRDLPDLYAQIFERDIPFVLAVNKIDLTSERTVFIEFVQDFYAHCNFPIIETSAKEGANVREIFNALFLQMVVKRRER